MRDRSPRHAASLLLLILLVLTVSSCPAKVRAATPPDVDVQIHPVSLQVPPSGATAYLVVRNRTDTDLHDVRVRWSSTAPVTLTVEPPSDPVLARFAEAVWIVHVTPHLAEMPVGAVHFRVDYAWDGADGPVPGVALASLAIEAKPPASAADIAQVDLTGAASSLSAESPAQAYLTVRNTGAVPLQLGDLRVHKPETVKVTDATWNPPASLQPSQIYVYTPTLEVAGAIQPGQQAILFEVPVAWQQDGVTRRGNLTASTTVDVSVFGSSEMAKLLGVPSFFFVPGFLILAFAGLLQRLWGWPNELKLNAKEFAALAVLLSLLAGFVYPGVTRLLLKEARNYRLGYEFADLSYVWFGALFTTLVGYSTVAGVARLLEGLRTRTIPMSGDEPLTLLRRLKWQGRGVKVPALRMASDEQCGLYVAQPIDGAREQTWMTPGIALIWDESRLDEDAEIAELRERIRNDINDNHVGALIRRLRKAQNEGALTIKWQKPCDHDQPYPMATEALIKAEKREDWLVVDRLSS